MKEHFLIKEIYTDREDTEQFDLVMVTAEVGAAADSGKLSESAARFETEHSVRKQFIAHCIDSELFVQVELCGSDLIDVEGTILSDDGRTLEMTMISEDGVPAGHASVDTASVTRLFVPVSEQHIV